MIAKIGRTTNGHKKEHGIFTRGITVRSNSKEDKRGQKHSFERKFWNIQSYL